MLRPSSPRTETIAYISVVTGNQVCVHFPEKRDDFRVLVKAQGFTWKYPYWIREMDSLSGLVIDRAAEIGRLLLAHGFIVAFDDQAIREKVITADYEPECRRWVLVGKGNYAGWFKLFWRRSEDCYHEAKKLTGSCYVSPCVMVSPEHYEEVIDFAELNQFRFSDEAVELAQQAHRQRLDALVIDIEMSAMPIATFKRPELDIPENIEIDDALLDEPL